MGRMGGAPMRGTFTNLVRDGWGPNFHIHSHQLKCKDPKLKFEGLHQSLTKLVRVPLIGAPPGKNTRMEKEHNVPFYKNNAAV